jgi:hypothetical protein
VQRRSTIDGSFTYNIAIGLISHQEWNQWLTRLKWRVINLDYNDVSTLLRTQRIIYTWENHWRYNQEWIIQRHWQQWVHNTKQTNKKTQPTKKNMSNTDPTKNRVWTHVLKKNKLFTLHWILWSQHFMLNNETIVTLLWPLLDQLDQVIFHYRRAESEGQYLTLYVLISMSYFERTEWSQSQYF